MSYVPPHLRKGFKPVEIAPRTHMTSGEVQHVLETRNWAVRAGGQLYFDGHGGSEHPHLHLQIASGRTGTLPRIDRDVRIAIVMLAWSDGRQHLGGGGKTFIWNEGNSVAPDWANVASRCDMNQAMKREFQWIMSYFTEG